MLWFLLGWRALFISCASRNLTACPQTGDRFAPRQRYGSARTDGVSGFSVANSKGEWEGLGEERRRTPVRPGDQLRLQARVQGARTSSSRPNLDIIAWAWMVLNQRDEGVLELDAASLFDLSDE